MKVLHFVVKCTSGMLLEKGLRGKEGGNGGGGGVLNTHSIMFNPTENV